MRTWWSSVAPGETVTITWVQTSQLPWWSGSPLHVRWMLTSLTSPSRLMLQPASPATRAIAAPAVASRRLMVPLFFFMVSPPRVAAGDARLRERDPRPGSGGLQDVHAAGAAQPDDVGQADPGALDLAVAGLAAEVVADLPDVGDAGGRDRVALRLEAAGDV